MWTVKNRLILKSFQSPGDIVMLSVAVRELHTAHPGRFQTDVRTSADAIWENNPHLTPLAESDPEVASIEMHYPLIHQSNERPYHFVHGYTQFLEQQLDLRIPITKFRGDIHLTELEKQGPPPGAALGVPDRFWIVNAGGKYDFTAKWWNPASYQAVVDHFQGRITFVQCGEEGHWHPRLKGVVDLVGKTSLREFIRLMYHADGVVCPVTLAMHLAIAVESKHPARFGRPCVVVAGGREPAHWEAYPNHQFISTNGTLPCCSLGGCWKSRCQLVGDGDRKDTRDVCDNPVQISDDLRIPQCMQMITPEEVIRRIELYHQGGLYDYSNNGAHGKANHMSTTKAVPQVEKNRTTDDTTPPNGKQRATAGKISVAFHHGLGDCVYFSHLIPLYVQRGYEVEVDCTPDKRAIFHAAGAKTIQGGAHHTHPWAYPSGATYEGHGRFWQGSKLGHNISETPLPNIGAKDELWEEYCDTRIDVEPLLPDQAKSTADNWLKNLPRPIVLWHTKGNTAQDRKSLPDATTAEFYKRLIDRCEGTLVLLDWDNRVPRLASHRIRHLDDLGSCSTETMLALMGRADLVVGVDSGPLHACRFTRTPTLGVWMPGHYPTTYTLPRREQVNVVLAEHTHQWNRFKRIPWNIVEHPGGHFSADDLAKLCAGMLGEPRYLTSDDIASDVQLQQFILTWCRGERGNSLSEFADRNRSFDVLFREATKRFQTPSIVETGVIRAEEDWPGAGFFTYLAASYLRRHGGTLHAVDVSRDNCRFARTWTDVFGEIVHVHQQDSVKFLQDHQTPIDVLYLDSLDTTEPKHAEHALREIEAALPKLHTQSIVVFDDTPWHAGGWVGKGARAVPFLLDHGWQILYAGYQVVLVRGEA